MNELVRYEADQYGRMHAAERGPWVAFMSHKMAVLDALEAKDAEIAALKEQLEYERIRLAACGQAALDNTSEAIQARRLPKDNQYYSASYGDVCAAVDREITLRNANARLRECLEPFIQYAVHPLDADKTAAWVKVTPEQYRRAQHALADTSQPGGTHEL